MTTSLPSASRERCWCYENTRFIFLSESTTLNAGVVNEYYLEPHDNFTANSFGSGLTEYQGENKAYIGITKEIWLCPSEHASAMSVLIPKHDYERMLSTDTLRVILLIIAFSQICCCLKTRRRR